MPVSKGMRILDDVRTHLRNALLSLVGVNEPDTILVEIERGEQFPVCGVIEGRDTRQSLVRYSVYLIDSEAQVLDLPNVLHHNWMTVAKRHRLNAAPVQDRRYNVSLPGVSANIMALCSTVVPRCDLLQALERSISFDYVIDHTETSSDGCLLRASRSIVSEHAKTEITAEFEEDHDIRHEIRRATMELARFHNFNVEYVMGSGLRVMDQRTSQVDVDDDGEEGAETAHEAMVALWRVISAAVRSKIPSFPKGFTAKMLRSLVFQDFTHTLCCERIREALMEFGETSSIPFMSLEPGSWFVRRRYKELQASIAQLATMGENVLNPNYAVIKN